MGAPQTLPADFKGWDQAPDTLPANFDKWDESPKTPPSAASRLGTNFLSGLGVTSNEDAKNFFRHPLDTVIKSLEAQGALAKKARDAYNRGDYMEALQHGLNYMVPFLGQQTDQAGTQLKEGDYAGGIGRTLGAAVPLLAGSPEAQTAAGEVASGAARQGAKAVRATARGINKGLEAAPGTIGAGVGSVIGAKVGGRTGAEIGGIAGAMAGKEILPKVRIPGEGFGLPSRVTGGPTVVPKFSAPEVEAPAPPSVSQPAVSQPGAAGSMAESVTAPPPGADYPRTISGEPALSGDSALRQVLVSEPNKTLLQIARSRGVNVSQESLLKPSNAVNNRIINKIIDNFSQDELDEIRAQHLESTRMGPQEFRGAIGKEANQTINLQTFFPELKIPLSRLLRTQKAIADAKAPVFAPKTDLAAQIKNQAQPRSIVTDPATGRPEFSDVVQAKQNAANPAAPKHPANAVPEDLTSILQESLRRAREQKAAQ